MGLGPWLAAAGTRQVVVGGWRGVWRGMRRGVRRGVSDQAFGGRETRRDATAVWWCGAAEDREGVPACHAVGCGTQG